MIIHSLGGRHNGCAESFAEIFLVILDFVFIQKQFAVFDAEHNVVKQLSVRGHDLPPSQRLCRPPAFPLSSHFIWWLTPPAMGMSASGLKGHHRLV
jgi:hypothetical protein